MSRPHSQSTSLSRPTTPLRPPSSASVISRPTTTPTATHAGNEYTTSAAAAATTAASAPLNTLEPAFAELADGLADLEANFQHLRLLHDSLARFSDSFASFLYGLTMNAFIVDFPEAPITESFRRRQQQQQQQQQQQDDSRNTCTSEGEDEDVDLTTMTATTSSTSFRATPRRKSVMPTPARNTGTAATSSTAAATARNAAPAASATRTVGATGRTGNIYTGSRLPSARGAATNTNRTAGRGVGRGIGRAPGRVASARGRGGGGGGGVR